MPLEGLEILVVEDHEDSRELFRVVLEQLGASVHTAASVDEAIAKSEGRLIDVVLTDIALPGRPGTWFVEEGRRSPVFASAAVLAVTGRQLAPSLQRLFEGVVLKPVDPDQLCSFILDALRRRP